MGWEVGVIRGDSSAKVILEDANHMFGGVAAMCIWGYKLEVDIVFVELFLHGAGKFVVRDVDIGSRAVLK